VARERRHAREGLADDVDVEVPSPVARPGVAAMARAVVDDLQRDGANAASSSARMRSDVRRSRQHGLERTHVDALVHAGLVIGVGIGPGARGVQRFELGDDDAAAEPGRTRILGVDGRTRPGQQSRPSSRSAVRRARWAVRAPRRRSRTPGPS
jgi:hypothetical protein